MRLARADRGARLFNTRTLCVPPSRRSTTMRKHLSAFRDEEDGAVTVDWVILTAGIVGFCIAAYSVTENATLGLRDGVSAELTRQNDF